ncbi:uncharacterized protein BX664DRAFT_341912 [Halteromyces radiatus]|uniref:uncharacterized protein n=1 Tax=Halteromyces radiatus TaxID=101107 RepID=UPI00221F63B6|nr:uncharacterized protein BX664DRAFT_341912 [Halteromyces radiatus]KAI8079965.1 hypothetical protein BX664DRAFT_341912 [Halteromyces radiatus]
MHILLIFLGILAYAFAFPTFLKNSNKEPPSPVPVDLFVMSKCPDAVYCESVFSTVLKKVNVPVTFDVNYIAQYASSAPFAHICKHGSSECLGNIQQLCFHKEYPDPKDWFSFNLCMNKNYQLIGLDDDLAKNCAQDLNKSYAPVEHCSHSATGVGLLTESAQKTKSLGVSSSCTVFIDNKLRCIHDGEWKNCTDGHEVDDFIQTIEDAYHKQNKY